MRYSGNRVI